MKYIIAASDGSEGANRALDYAAQMTAQLQCRLIVINVVSAIPPVLFRRFTPDQNTWLREAESALASEILRDAGERARKKGAKDVVLEPRTGDIVEAILETAREREVEMIVVGKRGTGRVQGLLLGSVSQKLVSLSPRPVLVVP